MIVGSPTDFSGRIHERALLARGHRVAWAPIHEVLDQIMSLSRAAPNGIPLSRIAESHPSAAGISPRSCVFVSNAPVIENVDAAIMVDDQHTGYYPAVAGALANAHVTLQDSPELVYLSMNKWIAHYHIATQVGQVVPDASLAFSRFDVHRVATTRGFPVVLKVPYLEQGHGVRISTDPVQLDNHLDELYMHDGDAIMVEDFLDLAYVKRITVLCDMTLPETDGMRILVTVGKGTESDNPFDVSYEAGLSLFHTELSNAEAALVKSVSATLGSGVHAYDVGIVGRVLPGREYLPAGSPVILEVNTSTGLRGAEFTGADVAGPAADLLLSKIDREIGPLIGDTWLLTL